MSSYLDQSLAKLEHFEGSVPWMYLDTVGKVTVGVGLMLPDVAAAQHLSFTLDNRPATPAEIAAEFTRVHALPMGRPAQFYYPASAPQLPQPEIDSLLSTVLSGFEADLRTRFPAYETFPDGVKLALLDMIYNLGPAGLFHGFPHLMADVHSGNWAAAAAGCFRHGPGAARNQWTHDMFLQSVVGTLKAESEGLLKQFAFGLIGLTAATLERLRRKRT
jgi:GH24 family phage-related lysozyme (muramidase)